MTGAMPQLDALLAADFASRCPFRRTGLAASTRSPTPWPSGTARRQTWQLAERQSPQITDLLCLAPAAGEQKFSGATALGETLSSLGDATGGIVLVCCCSQRFSRRTSGIAAQ